MFVLRTHYEYAIDDADDDEHASERPSETTSAGESSSSDTNVAAENLHGLCKLQPHPINFKALKRVASNDEFSPVVALLGPTAAGKSAIIREFKPSVYVTLNSLWWFFFFVLWFFFFGPVRLWLDLVINRCQRRAMWIIFELVHRKAQQLGPI